MTRIASSFVKFVKRYIRKQRSQSYDFGIYNFNDSIVVG
jgi:hypothetical protein